MGIGQRLRSKSVDAIPDVDLNMTKTNNDPAATFWLRPSGQQLLGCALCALCAGGNILAQDNAKKSPIQTPAGIPASTRGIPNPTGKTTGERSNLTGGWLTFEKCPVFALESIEIPSQEAGVIASIDVDENGAVEPNQVIGKLEGKVADLEKSVAGLQAQVAASEANDESEVRLAEAFVEEAQLQVDLYEEMIAKGTTGSADLRQKQLALSQAKVRLTQSKALKQQKELKSRLAQASVFLSQQKSDRLTLRSPISGTVKSIDHRPGEWVQAGVAIMKIIRLNELRVDCFVDIDQLDPAKLIEAPVKIYSKRGTTETLFAGKIASYDPDVSSAGKIRVHAIVQNQKSGKHWLLLPGMSVSMQLTTPQ